MLLDDDDAYCPVCGQSFHRQNLVHLKLENHSFWGNFEFLWGKHLRR